MWALVGQPRIKYPSSRDDSKCLHCDTLSLQNTLDAWLPWNIIQTCDERRTLAFLALFKLHQMGEMREQPSFRTCCPWSPIAICSKTNGSQHRKRHILFTDRLLLPIVRIINTRWDQGAVRYCYKHPRLRLRVEAWNTPEGCERWTATYVTNRAKHAGQ